MRRALVPLLAAALPAACGRFGEATSAEVREDAAVRPPVSDAGPPAEASDTPDAPSDSGPSLPDVVNTPTRECFTGPTGFDSWTKSGAVTAGPIGMVLNMTTTPAVMSKTFSLAANVRRTRVELESSIARGTYPARAYADVVAIYLGDTASYKTSPTVALEVLQSSLDVNVWFRPGGGLEDFETRSFLFGASYPPRLEVERIWPTGAMVFVTDGVSGYGSSASTSASRQVIITLGGVTHEGAPTTALSVREVCVGLD